MTCKDASYLVSERQDRPLGFRERWSLRMHLWMCVNCRRFARQLALMRQVMRLPGWPDEDDVPGADLTPEARERIRNTLAERSGHEP